MSCPDKERIEMLQNRMLDADAEREMHAHFEECESCKAFFDELKAVDELLGSVSIDLPGDDYLRSLSDRMKKEPGADEYEVKVSVFASTLSRMFWGITETAAALIIVCAISFLLAFKAPQQVIAEKSMNIEEEIHEMITARNRMQPVESEAGRITIMNMSALGMEI